MRPAAILLVPVFDVCRDDHVAELEAHFVVAVDADMLPVIPCFARHRNEEGCQDGQARPRRKAELQTDGQR